ncbi:ATP-binding protein [Leptothermofonsia sp. ETS-13]|uniref:ATP-binding protein n=1 Tax=Leptothermofonsia sp. ETS-13 TaxID=3035696 RepID=UPI003B9F0AFA
MSTARTETLVHPEDLQAELGIKKDAYYEDLKFLKGLGLEIQTRKDADNRVLLEPESADLIRELRQHVTATGRREGFRAGVLAEAQGTPPRKGRGRASRGRGRLYSRNADPTGAGVSGSADDDSGPGGGGTGRADDLRRPHSRAAVSDLPSAGGDPPKSESRRDCSPVIAPPPSNSPGRDASSGIVLDFRETELEQIAASLGKGQSLLVMGEAGSGKSELGQAIAQRFPRSVVATYGGSAKQTLMGIAEAFGIETETEEGKPRKLTAEILRAEILDLMKGGQRLLIADDAHRWPASLRYWLEDVLRAGGLMLLLADHPPAKDIFLKMPRLELEPLSADQVRSLMYAEAVNKGMALSPSRFAELQQKVRGNPGLAVRVIQEELMGLSESEAADHYFECGLDSVWFPDD